MLGGKGDNIFMACPEVSCRFVFFSFLLFVLVLGFVSSEDYDGLLYVADILDDTHHEAGDAARVIRKASKPTADDRSNRMPFMTGEATFICPDGFLLEGNKCTSRVEAPPVDSCPYGAYRNKAGLCISVDSVPPEKTCPAGFEWYLKGCIRREKIDAHFDCPHGFSKHGDFCVSKQILPPTTSCPDGYTVDGDSSGRCIKRSSSPAVRNCPHGFSLASSANNVCTRMHELPSMDTCAQGYVLSRDADGPICESTSDSVGKPRCKSGYEYLSNGMCQREMKTQPSLSCPDGSALNGSHCVKRTTVDALEVCEGNRVIDRITRLCVENSSDNYFHSKNFRSPLKGISDTSLGSPPVLTCPAGTIWDQAGHTGIRRCVRVSPVEAIVECHGGGSLVGGSCVSVSTQQPEYVFESKWCNERINDPSVVNGYTPDGLPVCRRTVRQTPKRSCEWEYKIGHHGSSVMCQRTEVRESTVSCPHGFMAENGSCFQSEETPGTITCPTGESPSSSGMCPSLLTSGMITTCPEGFKLGSYDKEEKQNALYDLCERIEYADVQVVCPLGYDRDRSHGADSKKACVAEKHVPPTQLCEPGFLSQGNVCVKVVEVSPSLVRSDGEVSACRPSRDGDPACDMETRYYARITAKGEKKGSQRQKKFALD